MVLGFKVDLGSILFRLGKEGQRIYCRVSSLWLVSIALPTRLALPKENASLWTSLDRRSIWVSQILVFILFGRFILVHWLFCRLLARGRKRTDLADSRRGLLSYQ